MINITKKYNEMTQEQINKHKKYRHEYYLKNKEKEKKQNKKWRNENKEKVRKLNIKTQIKYQKKYVTVKHLKYIGSIICPKCNRKGYLKRIGKYNKKTDKFQFIYYVVRHRIWNKEKKKMEYNGECYIGENYK